MSRSTPPLKRAVAESAEASLVLRARPKDFDREE